MWQGLHVSRGPDAPVCMCAQFLVEAANGPTTPEADLILRERDIPVLPDIYASGGAHCWFFNTQSRWMYKLLIVCMKHTLRNSDSQAG